MSESSPNSSVQDIRWIDRVAVVKVAGDIDLTHSVDFQQQLLMLLDSKPERIVINLHDVPYMDSSGVASLVKVLSRTRKTSTALYLAEMTPRVRSLFEITRLDSVFDIVATEQEALA